MADVRPFPGLRFDPAQVDLGAAVCPPFDVISPAEQRAYHARDPHNIVRVELGMGPADPDAPGNRYAAAAAALAAWRREGTLRPDATPAFYLYEHAFQHQHRTVVRRGLFVAGRLHEPSATGVLPHEDTRKGPITDRLALLRATATNVSPLWLLYEDADKSVARSLERGWDAPVAAVAEGEGERHSLRVVDDPRTLRAVVAAFAARPLYIADGHHRYKTAQVYRDERRGTSSGGRNGQPDGQPDAGYEFALMLLVPLDDPGLMVLPTHRLVRHSGRPLEDVRRALAQWLTLEPLPPPGGGTDATATALTRVLDAAGVAGHAFVLLEREGAWLLRLREDVDWRSHLPAGHGAAWQGLDVAVLDALAIRGACGIRAEAESAGAGEASHTPPSPDLTPRLPTAGSPDRLAYVSQAVDAVEAIRRGEADQAYLLNPTRVEQVCAVAAAGDRMPPKSTFFYPKPVTGLVLHSLEGTRPAP